MDDTKTRQFAINPEDDPFLDTSAQDVLEANGPPAAQLTQEQMLHPNREQIEEMKALGIPKPDTVEWGDWIGPKQLYHVHEYIVMLAATGMRPGKIAETMGMNAARISVILSNTKVRAAIRERQNEIFAGDVKQRIAANINNSMEALEKALDEGSDIRIRADTAKYLLDHHLGKATQKTEIKGTMLTEFLGKIDALSKSYNVHETVNKIAKPKDAIDTFVDSYVTETGIIGARTIPDEQTE